MLTASIFSMLPDLLGTSAFQYFKLKNASKSSVKAFVSDFVAFTKRNKFFSKWDKLTYRTTHTLLSLPFTAFTAFVFFRDIWWILTICYLSHLLVDLPTHEGEFAFRPLWPLSNRSLTGKSWATNFNLFFAFWAILIAVFLFQLVV